MSTFVEGRGRRGNLGFPTFDRKKLDDFNAKIRKAFNFLTIHGKYKIIGSAALKSVLYASDYDLAEILKRAKDTPTVLRHIYELFSTKFESAEKDPNIFITDFKCGVDSDGEPLRWSKYDMRDGHKRLRNGQSIRFQEALIQKSTIKLDAIIKVDSKFTEFSDNYYLKLGQDSNFLAKDVTEEAILKGIKESLKEYLDEKDYFKALKRVFSYKLLLNEKKYKDQLHLLLEYFNSPIGLLNKARSDLDILLLLLTDQIFRKPKIEDVKANLQLIAKSIAPVENSQNAVSYIESLMKNKSLKRLAKNITVLRDGLFNVVNTAAKEFIHDNPSIIKI